MSNRPVRLLVEDIWEAIGKINTYIEGLDQEEFEEDEMRVDAVIRNLEIIGEAANRLPENFKAQYAQVPWRSIIGLRHRIIHEYFGVDISIIWAISQNDLPDFQRALKAIRDQLEKDDE